MTKPIPKLIPSYLTRRTQPLETQLPVRPVHKPMVTHNQAEPLEKIPAASAPLRIHSYTVQLGVFSDHANAAKLHQKLQQHGISAKIDTRVHLGPFQDRTDAARVFQKLKQLGIQPVLIPNAIHASAS